MGRTQRPPAGEHRHCEKCFNKRCQAPVNTGISCPMTTCRLHCDATFHMCKEEEHRLLCPLEWVPCLNSVFGCPFSMSRFKLAKHLKVCPASVVCCSMDWNRWPVIDREGKLFENLMKDRKEEESLDVALALRDQSALFGSLKMAELFPELSEDPRNTISLRQADEDMEEVGAVGGTDLNDPHGMVSEKAGLSQYEREALARSKADVDTSKFSDWERMFSKEKSTAKYLESNAGQNDPKNQNASKDATPDDVKNKSQDQKQSVLDLEKTGFAPWQEGVLERLKSEVDCGSYNMYLVHHGSMLIRFGQMAACTPREKDFVYGKLEAQVVKTVHTFKVPVSYCGRRAKLGDDRSKVEKAQKLVDTSDLGVDQKDLPLSDTVYTTLLGALEKELRGHSISETKALDGLLIDVGTQTYDFGMDAFSNKTVLADVLGEGTLGLHLDIESECVTRRHNKNNSSFTFSCNLFFRRDEFPFHFKNAHADIQSCLDGWFQQRCPLAYLGCTFVQNRFQPEMQKSQVIYSKDLKTFALKPQVASSLYEGVRPNLSRSHRGKSKDSLTALPLEVLQHIAGFLDSFSLYQLSQVSVLLRDICATLLQERGMVHLYWEKKTYSHGGTSWRARRKVWSFSSLFSPVHRWQFDDIPSMSEHLKICPFNAKELKKQKFQLPSVFETQKENKETLLSLRKKL
ncbi:F-box only protein 40 [Spea bombifrons]|uniref:F-box only protein 40 n=1 Tax=Spea bombifrons TaxID=233779 RepID=UPI00234BEFA1|nr:F-box only protein 40 [Spea bombifrons]